MRSRRSNWEGDWRNPARRFSNSRLAFSMIIDLASILVTDSVFAEPPAKYIVLTLLAAAAPVTE